MNKNNYTPQPIDAKDVMLPQKHDEIIAKNEHEVWSTGRMKDGWTYGDERNDSKMKYPCLVPYGQLTKTAKKYERIS